MFSQLASILVFSEHKKELEATSTLDLERRHRDEFPGWFKRRVSL